MNLWNTIIRHIFFSCGLKVNFIIDFFKNIITFIDFFPNSDIFRWSGILLSSSGSFNDFFGETLFSFLSLPPFSDYLLIFNIYILENWSICLYWFSSQINRIGYFRDFFLGTFNFLIIFMLFIKAKNKIFCFDGFFLHIDRFFYLRIFSWVFVFCLLIFINFNFLKGK